MSQPSQRQRLKMLDIFERSVREQAPGGSKFKYYQFIFDTKHAYERYEQAKVRLDKFKKKLGILA